jgi:ribosomal protein L11 methyltransferase
VQHLRRILRHQTVEVRRALAATIMRAYCLTCELTLETADLVQAAWYGLGMLGCEEEGLGHGMARLKCYFRDSVSLHTAEFRLMDISPSIPISITIVADQDWNATWKKNMRPVSVASGIWVSPAWLSPPLKQGDRWIKIEPKMAFGTGHHETTRLASHNIIGLSAALSPRWHMLDIGTGSGILCFVADCGGCAEAIGIDRDPVCLANLAENKRKNKTAASLAFAIGTIDMIRGKDRFDCVVMNMISPDGLPLLQQIYSLLRPKGFFIFSGLLLEERKTVSRAALSHGFHLHSQSHENEWWCGTFVKDM